MFHNYSYIKLTVLYTLFSNNTLIWTSWFTSAECINSTNNEDYVPCNLFSYINQ